MPPEDKDNGKLEGWMIVEMMGHQRLAGYVREVPVGGSSLLRVDVPEVTFKESVYDYQKGVGAERDVTIPAFTKFVSPNSLYALTPTTAECAAAEARRFKSMPVAPAQQPQLGSARRALPPPEDDSELPFDFEDRDDREE